jgi:hypothetical protein
MSPGDERGVRMTVVVEGFKDAFDLKEYLDGQGSVAMRYIIGSSEDAHVLCIKRLQGEPKP